MGFGEDWKAAMEKVKDTYVEPGKQPELIRQLARQAEEFFDKHDWITIPQLAKEDWYMEMLSPERQRASPDGGGSKLFHDSHSPIKGRRNAGATPAGLPGLRSRIHSRGPRRRHCLATDPEGT